MPTSDRDRPNGNLPEYNSIAADYSENAEERSDRTCVLAPSARFYLGGVKGLSVLDLACGSGYFTRLIKRWGASQVTGIDISSEMIALARREEAECPLGIQYQIGDVAALEDIGTFDKVFAAFLLHYAPSIEVLSRMCKTICASLKPGGTFDTFSANPFKPLHEGLKYDVTVRSEGPIRNGCKITRTHHAAGVPQFSFDHFHYDRETYEIALQQAGFGEIQWQPFVLAEDAKCGFSTGYWDEYLSEFSILCLRAVKLP